MMSQIANQFIGRYSGVVKSKSESALGKQREKTRLRVKKHRERMKMIENKFQGVN